MKSTWIIATIACSITLAGATAEATIIGGTVTKISPPANVGNNNQQDPRLLGFDERQDVLLSASLAVDNPAGTIAAGTWVRSHYIIYDPVGTTSIVGTAIFDEDILGIMTKTATLNASDFLGAPATSYLNPSLRGLESGDTATITAARTVSFDLTASSPGDYIRVVTAPEPVTLWVFGAAAPMVLKRKRKSH